MMSWKLVWMGCLALAVIASSSLLISGFEAHVVNVTAQIEDHRCDPRSLEYWNSNEGCSEGTGSSIWADDISELSAEFSGVFAGNSGEDICKIIWINDCPSGNSVAARECRARAYAMALELNIVSNRLNVEALLAGADDGSRAFERLNLDAFSTIKQAITAIEAAIAHPGFLGKRLVDAAYVAKRIIKFYEQDNPFGMQCIFDPDDASKCIPKPGDTTLAEEVIDEILDQVNDIIPDSPVSGLGTSTSLDSATSTITSTSTPIIIQTEDESVATTTRETIREETERTPRSR